MLSFGGDCFMVRKLNGKMIEGGFYQSKLICLLEQLLVNLFSEKSILYARACAAAFVLDTHIFQKKPKPTYRLYLHI